MKTLAVFLLMVLSACSAFGDAQTAKWWAEEQKCISNCPKMPRFSGTETNEQFKERIRKTDEYNRCKRQCVTDYVNKVRPWRERFDDGSKGYFERNK